MTAKLCLRCDWSGDGADATCPRCGAGLFARAPGPRTAPDAAGAQASETGEERIERSWRNRVALVLVVVLAIGAVVFVQRHTPSPAVATAVSTGHHGFLLAPAKTDGGVRMWVWNLDANTAVAGPMLDGLPEELVYGYEVHSGWVGITTASDDGMHTASVLHYLGVTDRPVTVARGDRIAWLPGESSVSVVRSTALGGCRRRVSVNTWFVVTRQAVERYAGVLCGTPTAFVRDREGPYLTVDRNGTPRTLRVGAGYVQRILPGRQVLGASVDGDLLVQRPGGGLELYYASPAPIRPIAIEADGHALDPIRVLAWNADASQAFVLGSIQGVQGIFRVMVGPRPRPRPPSLVLATNAVDVQATPTADGDLYISTDGAISLVHAGHIEPIPAPAGAPGPLGPVLWVATLAYSPAEG
ncbi:MAG: hypothetical protein ABJB55_03625 [Actinomycetota bacterium]